MNKFNNCENQRKPRLLMAGLPAYTPCERTADVMAGPPQRFTPPPHGNTHPQLSASFRDPRIRSSHMHHPTISGGGGPEAIVRFTNFLSASLANACCAASEDPSGFAQYITRECIELEQRVSHSFNSRWQPKRAISRTHT